MRPSDGSAVLEWPRRPHLLCGGHAQEEARIENSSSAEKQLEPTSRPATATRHQLGAAHVQVGTRRGTLDQPWSWSMRRHEPPTCPLRGRSAYSRQFPAERTRGGEGARVDARDGPASVHRAQRPAHRGTTGREVRGPPGPAGPGAPRRCSTRATSQWCRRRVRNLIIAPIGRAAKFEIVGGKFLQRPDDQPGKCTLYYGNCRIFNWMLI